ncbi:type II secretion system protein GspN [Chondromyces apiculatus]|uniref:Type II secretion system protein GspN n=1 Tax=Chondromyces apiculatus DSM 436 TaxID=1192034 RepID=A0A017T0Y5_9BACT|nr:type II secretion system protein GspN [Chondromyces apiculatus]EYF02914.1 Hypothetical protein CAP_6337 [Chondromyces apiculatus DSM 436]
MKERFFRVAKWLAYPAFYLLCLFMFGYLTFPYDRLKDRLIAEFDRTQSKRGGAAAQKLEIDELDSYWFTGVEVKGARLIMPPADGATGRSTTTASAGAGSADAKATGPKPTVIEIDEAHARVRLLPLLLGRVRVDFWASVFGGEVQGVAPVGKTDGAIEVEMENLDLSKIEPLGEAIGGIPLRGTVSGKLELEAPEGKFNKADGLLELTGSEVMAGDGKTKIKGLIELPTARLGDLTISAEAKEGVLKITKLSAGGPDIELEGDGKVNVREPWNNSSMDLYVRFKFSDAYRGKNDTTKSVLGDPSGSGPPPLIETLEPRMKRAKRSDGFYGWHAHGALKRPKFDPHATDTPAATRQRGKSSDSPFAGGGTKKPGGLGLPLGTSEAKKPGPSASPDKEVTREKEQVEPPSEPMPVPAPPPAPEEAAPIPPEPAPEPRAPVRGEDQTDENPPLEQ